MKNVVLSLHNNHILVYRVFVVTVHYYPSPQFPSSFLLSLAADNKQGDSLGHLGDLLSFPGYPSCIKQVHKLLNFCSSVTLSFYYEGGGVLAKNLEGKILFHLYIRNQVLPIIRFILPPHPGSLCIFLDVKFSLFLIKYRASWGEGLAAITRDMKQSQQIDNTLQLIGN